MEKLNPTEYLKKMAVGALAVASVALGACTTAPSQGEAQQKPDYIVTSTGDLPDANSADGICADELGDCTLRAAIEQSNVTAGAQTIGFDITGNPDYSLHGQNGYTIKPKDDLPIITDTVVLNGWTQPESKPNTIAAPGPMNATPLVEISGDDAPGLHSGFDIQAPKSIIKGLTVDGFKNTAIGIGADYITVQGMNVGTTPDGMHALPNKNGVSQSKDGSTHAMIGGQYPAERNLISGNLEGGSSPNTGSDYWTYWGNVFGLSADQTSALPNSAIGGAGAISLDNSSHHIIGGMLPGQANVSAGNDGHGFAPDHSDDTQIVGNLDGVNYLGQPFGNKGEGIVFSNSKRAFVSHNNVSNNVQGGIGVHNGSDNAVVTSNTVEDNGTNGITFVDSSYGQIGSPNQGNKTRRNRDIGIEVTGLFGEAKENRVQANGVEASTANRPNSMGAITVRGNANNNLIGGTNQGEGNTVTNPGAASIAVQSLRADAVNYLTIPSGDSILGNMLTGNITFGGIDLLETVDTSNPPDGVAEQIINSGPTPNDLGDTDPGPNSYINTPVLSSAVQNGSELSISFNLDSVGSTVNGMYRIEFYIEDPADESETFFGSVNATNGQSIATLTLPNGIDLTNKKIRATTTALSNVNLYGYAETSEFSPAI